MHGTAKAANMAPVAAHTTRSPNGVGPFSWKTFLDGGSKGVSEVVVLQGKKRVELSWVDGHSSEFSLEWLRDHSDGSFHVNTKQRKVKCRLEKRGKKNEIQYVSLKSTLIVSSGKGVEEPAM